MLGLFRNIATNAPQAISRTFLDHEARKTERRFLGPVGGAQRRPGVVRHLAAPDKIPERRQRDAGIDVVNSEYATIAAEQSALERLADDIADQIVARIALYAERSGKPQ